MTADLVLLLLLAVLACCITLFTADLAFNDLSLSSVTTSPVIAPTVLCLVRMGFAGVIWVTLLAIVLDRRGIDIVVIDAKNRKRNVTLKSFQRLTMFTVWSWIIQGVYFTMTAYAGLTQIFPTVSLPTFSPLVLDLIWILYEISFPIAFLVSGIVTYILIPHAVKHDIPPTSFYKLPALLMHNANLLFIVWEFFINPLIIHWWHFPWLIFYGLSYVLFAWVWHWSTGMFYYFFLDYGRTDALWHYLALLCGVIVLHAGAAAASWLWGRYPLVAGPLIVTLTYLSMKIRRDDHLPDANAPMASSSAMDEHIKSQKNQ